MKHSAHLSARKYLVTGIIAVIVLVGGFGTWSSITPISGAVIARGQIEVDRNRQVVQHPDGGVVAQILVEEGQRVSQNDILIRLDPSQLQTQLTIIEDQLFETLARRGRFEAERDNAQEPVFDKLLIEKAASRAQVNELKTGQERLFNARRATLAQEISQLSQRQTQIRGRISGLEAQQAANKSQLDLVQQELTNQQDLLDKGLAQASRVLSLRREIARLIGIDGELMAQISEARENITQVDIEKLRLAARRREDAIAQLREVQIKELGLREQRTAILDQLARTEVRAPVAGLVYGLTVFAQRSVIRPADPLMYLVPQDRPLVIYAQIDPIHIDLVHLNQDVILRLSALDLRQTPEVKGVIDAISADAFVEQNTGRSFYRAKILLNESELAKLPENITLLPGMPVETYILTNERTPLQYLLKTFLDYFAKAFRET